MGKLRLLEALRSDLERRIRRLEGKDPRDPKSKKDKEKSKTPKHITLSISNMDVLKRKKNGQYVVEVDGWQCFMKEVSIDDMNEQQRIQLEREVSLLQELPNHPNIVKYLFHQRDRSMLRIFTAAYSSTLRNYITKYQGVSFSASQIKCWLFDVICGLEFLHKSDVIHRNITVS
jgi:serine/threonine protein kinase